MFRCTSVYGTPTMFVDMLRVQRENKFDLSRDGIKFLKAFEE